MSGSFLCRWAVRGSRKGQPALPLREPRSRGLNGWNHAESGGESLAHCPQSSKWMKTDNRERRHPSKLCPKNGHGEPVWRGLRAPGGHSIHCSPVFAPPSEHGVTHAIECRTTPGLQLIGCSRPRVEVTPECLDCLKMIERPGTQGFDWAPKRLAQCRQFVVDPGWHARKQRALDEPVSLQARNTRVSMRWEIPPTPNFSSLKRFGPFFRDITISTLHLSPMRASNRAAWAHSFCSTCVSSVVTLV